MRHLRRDDAVTNQCTCSGSAIGEPWRCPDCGTLWEPLPQQAAEHAGHQADMRQADTPPWAEEPMSTKGVVIGVAMGCAVGLPMLLQYEMPILAGVLAVVGIGVLAWWFWQVVRG